jgi:hypothetical protein
VVRGGWWASCADSLTGSEVGAGEEEDDEGAEEGLGEEEGESEEGEEEDAEGREEEEEEEDEEGEGEEESMEDVEGGKHDSGGMEGITAAAEEAAAAAQLSRKRKSDYLQSGDIDPEAEPDADGGSGDNTATAANNLNGQPHTGPDGLSVALKLPPTTTTTSTTEDATQPEVTPRPAQICRRRRRQPQLQQRSPPPLPHIHPINASRAHANMWPHSSWWLVVGGWWLVAGGWWLVVFYERGGGWWLVLRPNDNRRGRAWQRTTAGSGTSRWTAS